MDAIAAKGRKRHVGTAGILDGLVSAVSASGDSRGIKGAPEGDRFPLSPPELGLIQFRIPSTDQSVILQGLYAQGGMAAYSGRRVLSFPGICFLKKTKV